MKDIIITRRQQQIEIASVIVCFIISFGVNVYAIISYHAPAIEMITSIFYVLAFTLVLYVLWVVIRLVIAGVKRLFKKKTTIKY